MRYRGALAAGLILGLTLATLTRPGTALAQQPLPSVGCAATKRPLAGLVDWVVAEGHRESLPAAILGLPEAGEVTVFQKAYRNPSTHLVRAVDVNVAHGRCDLVFIIDDLGNVTTWVTDVSAVIVRTLHSARAKNEVVPNERYVSEYETIKSYFLERLPDRYAR
jgi:hypothetical protein